LSPDSKHVEALRRGPRSWNQWRIQNPSLTPNLAGISLSAAERQMGPISGGPINFSFARLRHASLRFATLSGANLEMADLSDADLCDARLDGADLSGADLCEAVLERADFSGARLGGANLAGANLSEARNLTQGQIDDALGDALTLIPSHLVRPRGWGGGVPETVSNLYERNGVSHGSKNGAAQNGVAPNGVVQNGVTERIRGDSISWLVGGPGRV
jgi:Pentapeptide repeats (8 copies)